jgi:hypothetical protein
MKPTRTLIPGMLLALMLSACSGSTPGSFTLSLPNPELTVQQGSSAEVTLSVTSSDGFDAPVTVTLANPPVGISAAPLTIPAGAASGTLTLAAGNDAAVGGPTSLTVTGTSGSLRSEANLSLSVTSPLAPTVIITPDAAAVTAGGPAVSFTATATSSSSAVTWSLSGPGSIAPKTGLTTLYTPPASVTSSTTSTLTAALAGTDITSTATLTIDPPSIDPPAISLTVDPAIQPPVAALPGFEDGKPRPVAAVTGDDSSQAEFVANEVWLQSDDDAQVQAFVARWNGTVLKTFDPSGAAVSGLPKQHLIRIDASAADTSRLAQDLRALHLALEPTATTATGGYKVSSQAGLDLIAAASAEAADGLDVGMNWVGSGAQFRDRTSLEAPSGPALAGVAYTPDAFRWPSHSSGSASVQDIGVAEAWRALDLAGKLGNRVKLAVLDMGFQPDADWQGGYIARTNVPLTKAIGTKNLLSCSGGNTCPWHGTQVVSAAMGLPDNQYGAAGPAGPVAQPVIVFTLYDFFTSMRALFDAGTAGAKIANMSYGAPVPWYAAWSVLPFEATTAALRTTGMLLFAAAGNEGKNVDAEGCTLGVCWERTWHTPCENAGVICVGGLGGNSKNRASGSNYGGDQVDIFAPYTLWLGPDPASPGNQVQVLSGTSFSSPFAAGVAALIWAANPGLSAGAVEDILMNTAHPSPDPNVGRYVNALGAVRAALGNVPPSITLGASGDVPLNVELSLSAEVQDFEDAFPCCTVRWTSDVDGPLGSGYSVTRTFTTLGKRIITVTATDSGGATTTERMTLNVVNNAPDVTLSKPLEGDEVFRSASVVLRGRASDRNEPQEQLACSRLVWTSSVAGDPFPVTGCEAEVVFATNGPRTLTLTATDPQGSSDTATVSISVVEPPPNLPPFVQISSPEDHAQVRTDEPLTLSGTATDPEGATELSYQWTVKLFDNAPIVVGNAPTVEWTPNDTYDFSGAGTYTVQVRLNVTDPEGNTGTDVIVLEWLIIL